MLRHAQAGWMRLKLLPPIIVRAGSAHRRLSRVAAQVKRARATPMTGRLRCYALYFNCPNLSFLAAALTDPLIFIDPDIGSI
jgi:hypothetical protein